MARTLRAIMMALVLGAVPVGGMAQAPLAPGVPQSAVVVLDRELLFAESLFGQRVARDIEMASTALAAENRTIEADLEAEEQALTARRAEMDPVAFREMAAAFDSKVVGIRRTQDAKGRAIQQQSERAQAVFFERANPLLIQLARETGALVILDRRTVIASADQVDITDLARDRIDTMLGDGAGLDAPTTPVPETPETTAPEE
ncbi:MAG: OmpH family outer membrane protein [Pseudomonadota bacterium]